MLKVNETHESFRRVFREDTGTEPVLALSLTMSRDEYALQVEMLNRDYLDAHGEELTEAIRSFLCEAEERLLAAQLPVLPRD